MPSNQSDEKLVSISVPQALAEFLLKREPGEPVFLLLGRDLATPATIRVWATLWQQEIRLGLRPEEDRAQISAALALMTEAEIFADARNTRLAHAKLTFDNKGRPTTGQHSGQQKSGAI